MFISFVFAAACKVYVYGVMLTLGVLTACLDHQGKVAAVDVCRIYQQRTFYSGGDGLSWEDTPSVVFTAYLSTSPRTHQHSWVFVNGGHDPWFGWFIARKSVLALSSNTPESKLADVLGRDFGLQSRHTRPHTPKEVRDNDYGVRQIYQAWCRSLVIPATDNSK